MIIKNLAVRIQDKVILSGLDLEIPAGKTVALMGPNGSGKSTLANVLMGHPAYHVEKGTIQWKRKNIVALEPWQRARMGFFLSFQYPYEIPGVNFYEFLLASFKSIHGQERTGIEAFDKRLSKALKDLKLPVRFLSRDLNSGFSGGEKKKAEILQLKILQPSLAILDETDSGLDIDALRLIAKNIREMKSPKIGFLIITHYQRLLNYIKPDIVHVMINGKIVKTGGPALVKKLEKEGYSWLSVFPAKAGNQKEKK
ncbi:Fe-S cluster assembly ATPase SufC [Candidatus Amesbacteria bacterium]|nr:Fe-S cluster assembly ATPase SufC [Candidatus Amesbacteria bacterium]MBI5412532.1 Fe-S cluster assembly ATPase SufC [Candidatus Peregrinibacteria bacterium]